MNTVNALFEEYEDAVSKKAKIEAELFELSKKLSLKQDQSRNLDLVVRECKKRLQESFNKEEQRPSRQSPLFKDDYEINWTIKDKAYYIIDKLGHCLTLRDIVDRIKKLEGIKSADSERTLLSSVSATLSSKASKGKDFGRYRNSNTDEWKYGLIEWFVNSGDVLKEHKRPNNLGPF